MWILLQFVVLLRLLLRSSQVLSRLRVIAPQELTDAVHPWVEVELEKIKSHNRAMDDPDDRDMSTEGFLETMVWLKVVFLQDMAILGVQFPKFPILTHPVFKLPQ